MMLVDSASKIHVYNFNNITFFPKNQSNLTNSQTK